MQFYLTRLIMLAMVVWPVISRRKTIWTISDLSTRSCSSYTLSD